MLSYLVPEEDGFSGSYYNIKEALGLSEVQYGVVTGTAFTFTNGAFGLIFGHLADIYPRKWIWIIACLLWTLCTFAESYTTSFGTILPARMGFAVFMGSCVPVSVSILADFTLPKERGFAQAIFAAGVYLGGGMGSLSLLLDKAVGWRNTIRIICGVSWGMATTMFFVPEPKRNATNKEEAKMKLAE